ncbi:MAG: hypothetical protein WDA22_17360 [Bacteroidota bacterium]
MKVITNKVERILKYIDNAKENSSFVIISMLAGGLIGVFIFLLPQLLFEGLFGDNFSNPVVTLILSALIWGVIGYLNLWGTILKFIISNNWGLGDDSTYILIFIIIVFIYYYILQLFATNIILLYKLIAP